LWSAEHSLLKESQHLSRLLQILHEIGAHPSLRGVLKIARNLAVVFFFPKRKKKSSAEFLLASSLLMMEVADSDRASSNSFRKRSFSSSALRHLSSRSERYFAFLSRYALWMMSGREGGSVVSFRLPLVICEPRWFVWTRSQIAKFVIKLNNP
jgi:hypothetical protein